MDDLENIAPEKAKLITLLRNNGCKCVPGKRGKKKIWTITTDNGVYQYQDVYVVKQEELNLKRLLPILLREVPRLEALITKTFWDFVEAKQP